MRSDHCDWCGEPVTLDEQFRRCAWTPSGRSEQEIELIGLKGVGIDTRECNRRVHAHCLETRFPHCANCGIGGSPRCHAHRPLPGFDCEVCREWHGVACAGKQEFNSVCSRCEADIRRNEAEQQELDQIERCLKAAPQNVVSQFAELVTDAHAEDLEALRRVLAFLQVWRTVKVRETGTGLQ